MSRRHRRSDFTLVLDGGFVANAVDIQSGSCNHICWRESRQNFHLLIWSDVKRSSVYRVAKMHRSIIAIEQQADGYRFFVIFFFQIFTIKRTKDVTEAIERFFWGQYVDVLEIVLLTDTGAHFATTYQSRAERWFWLRVDAGNRLQLRFTELRLTDMRTNAIIQIKWLWNYCMACRWSNLKRKRSHQFILSFISDQNRMAIVV